MEKYPLVSIVSVYYNREDFIEESIKSLLNQTYKNLEIVIIDDGSTDKTLKKLKKFQKDKRVKVITHNNMGFVKSIRKGIKISTGKLIAINGSGDISFSNRIEKQVDYLKSNNLDVVGSYVFKGEKLYELHFNNNQSLPKQFLKHNPVAHGSALFKRNIYDKVGGYRKEFKYAQDLDLWCRMSLEGKFGIVPEALCKFNNPENSVSKNANKKLFQKYYSFLARECLKERLYFNKNKDKIDKFGKQAFFIRKKNKKLAFDLFITGVVYFRDGQPKNSRMFVEKSTNEMNIIVNFVFLYLLRLIQSSNLLTKLLRKSLKKITFLKKIFS